MSIERLNQRIWDVMTLEAYLSGSPVLMYFRRANFEIAASDALRLCFGSKW
jgi:hypothetical protein